MDNLYIGEDKLDLDDRENLDTRYLSKGGGTLTGPLSIDGTNNVDSRQATFKGANTVYVDMATINGAKASFGWSDSSGKGSTYMYSYPSNKYLNITDDGILNFNGATIWNSENDSSSGGLFRNRGDISENYIDNGNSNYKNYPSGVYKLLTGGYSQIFINFALNNYSTSAFQLLGSYQDTSYLKFRYTIDGNRVGSWRTIVTTDTQDRVGIGTQSPSEKLHVVGNIKATGVVTQGSDARLKSDIVTLENRGYLQPKSFIKDGRKEIGFIAQDVYKLYPELVYEDNSEERMLSLNYGGITAVLEAQIFEQKKEIDFLKEELFALKEEIASLKDTILKNN